MASMVGMQALKGSSELAESRAEHLARQLTDASKALEQSAHERAALESKLSASLASKPTIVPMIEVLMQLLYSTSAVQIHGPTDDAWMPGTGRSQPLEIEVTCMHLSAGQRLCKDFGVFHGGSVRQVQALHEKLSETQDMKAKLELQLQQVYGGRAAQASQTSLGRLLLVGPL